ncbi:MAG: GTPase ObgE [Oscillospiraceae bacterium]|nr:GTPase ObgE [Oscillospiraceae bacterium]
MFIDTATIYIRAGNGGDGAVSFHREKYVAAGGPDGGDGGRGGNVVFVPDDGLNTLADFRYRRKFLAENGQPGSGKRCSGKSGADLTIRVPRGTLIYDNKSGRLMADLSGDVPFIAARGGRGGWGNSHFATPTRQVPRFAKPGNLGEEYEIRLELKLLADVGLVGFPNVGKSSLLSVVSEAKPEIANYHFTTLTPVLGVVRVAEGASFVMADIPGIIEGAGKGVGLGHDFLRHIERCRLLVHVVDVSGSEGRNPLEDVEVINKELKEFNTELASRPMIIAGNKCDLTDEQTAESFAREMRAKGYEYFPLIAPISHGTDTLIKRCAALLSELPPVRVYEPEPDTVAESGKLRDESISISRRDDGAYVVEGEWLKHFMRGININEDESLMYLHRVLQSKGVIDTLRKAGVTDGNTVSIYGFEFDFVD